MSAKKPTPPAVPSLKLLAEHQGFEGVSKITTFKVDPNLVTFEKGFNVRTEDDLLKEHQEKLFLAIKNGASLPPIDVRVENGVIICVEGHSRTLAARRFKKEMPEYTLEARQFRGNEQERVLHMLGTGNGQKPLSPLESGIGYLRLIKWGMTPQEIADKQGVSRVTIDNNIALAEAPVEVQNLIRSGVVSSTTARDAVKAGPEGVKALVKAAATPETPTPDGKKPKKKKVTAAKLKNTAAAKKPKTKRAKAAEKKQTVAGWNTDLGMNVGGEQTTELTKTEFLALASNDPNEFTVKLNRIGAQVAINYLKANAPDNNPDLNTFIASIELALM